MEQVKFDTDGFTLTSGYILAHICDSNGVYTHSEEQFVSIGCGLAANAVLDKPLPTKQGFAVQRVGNKWQYVVDNRGKTVYSTTNKTPLTITEIGAIPAGYTEIEPTHPYSEWNGQGWVISPAQQAVKKAEDIAKMREAINALRDSKINGGVYVEAVGKWIDTDATAERNILSVKASYDLFGDMEIAWTCADNSILMINKNKLMLIWQALMAAKTSNHANALRHKEAVEQAKNPLEYDYSDGWTQCYYDHLKELGNE